MNQPLLKINKINFIIDNKELLSDLSLDVYKGDFIVLLGANGSGKSTLLKLINRTYKESQGEIYLKDILIGHYKNSQYAHRVLTISQSTRENLFYDMTVFENAKIYLPTITKSELSSYLHAFNPKLVQHINSPVDVLSGGEQQVLVLALCLKLKPELLLLDEHTSGLDPKTAEQIMQLTHKLITQHQVTCIMTTHNLKHALQYGNRLIAINSGRLIQQFTPFNKLLLKHSDLLHLCYEPNSTVELVAQAS